MVPQERDPDPAFATHQALVDKLNLDQRTAKQAWDSYQHIRSRYNLEGDQLNWLGCSVFVACRSTVTPTVGKSQIEGNCVSLTSLLRCSNFSLVQFFDKIKKWGDMTKMSEDFRNKIARLESKIRVTYNTFHSQYTPVFIKIFKVPDYEQKRNRKQKPIQSTPKRIFEFCWLLFLTVKGEMKNFDDNIVNSYQLLYAIFDYVFQNAFVDDRKDLINPNFSGLPNNWSNAEYRAPNVETPSVIQILYEHKEDIKDVMYIKEYSLKSIIKDWFSQRILQGNSESLTGILNMSVFENNFYSLTKVYEQLLLSNGDIDDRIFLKEYFRQKSIQDLLSGESYGAAQATEFRGPYRGLVTPLTCRRYLQSHDIPDSTASGPQNIARLKNILAGRIAAPRDELLRTIFKDSQVEAEEALKEKITSLQTTYCVKCQQEVGSNLFTEDAENVAKRSALAVTLTYKLLEDVVRAEKRDCFDMASLVKKPEFLSSIFICSVEIVEFCFNNYNDKFSRKFPWILKALDVSAFSIVKIIEITIRSTNGQLPRNIIKHLIKIEETCLESLMWKSDSVLWEEIVKDGNTISKFEEVALPHQMNKHLNIIKDRKELPPGLISPAPSAVETFQSSPVHSVVKKNLFPDIKPGQSLLHNNKSATHVVVDADGTKKLIRISEKPPSELSSVMASPQPPPPPVDNKPKKGGGLAIVLRKFYNLAGVRMFELCKSLNISELQQKIWTVLEYSVREANLMKDRHLDQLLMCAVYVVCKLSQRSSPIQFTDHIMKAYRNQPQATSDVYRKVRGEFLDGAYKEIDLIEFYNSIYTERVKDFALKFKLTENGTPNRTVVLSPLPSEKILRASPRTEIVRNVFIKPYDSPTRMLNGENTMKYCFSRSTSADLRQINAALSSTKRKFPEELDARRPLKQTKMATLLEERRVQSKESKVETRDELPIANEME